MTSFDESKLPSDESNDFASPQHGFGDAVPWALLILIVVLAAWWSS